MENYRIYFDPEDRLEVVAVLRQHNDVIIDNINDDSIGITIEREDADHLYQEIRQEIIERLDREPLTANDYE